jgi:hypothetical protein
MAQLARCGYAMAAGTAIRRIKPAEAGCYNFNIESQEN